MPIHKLGRLVEDWREIEAADIPLEPMKVRVGANQNAGLTMKQMPTDYGEAMIREFKHCVAYVMPVFIRRDEPGRTIIRACTLDVPWDDSVEWLDQDKREIEDGIHSRETTRLSTNMRVTRCSTTA